ncbi:CFEM domain-containing protein [Dactylonectria macrodidyma]|uniref:CFEM domain-containing protein n=1 Tax=Dactylonectria macrodidyma TaxID=307937 RepID=A0A9P9EQ48_9HYPO|nr:CFEM domain-containing protein [Dactylonectria macrodidyma]
MDVLHCLVLVFVSLFLVPTRAKDSFSNLPGLPSCATPCIDAVFQAELCPHTNQTCICTNEQFQETLRSCVAANCTIPETLTTQNASLDYCDAPTRDRTENYIVSSITLACIAGVFVVIRFACKIFVGSLSLGLDDWLVLLAMITVVPTTIITVTGMTASGLGKDIWTLTADQITNTLRYLWITGLFYFIQSPLVKLAIIAFFLRIFPSQGVQRLLWATFILNTLWGFACILGLIFQCKPTSYFWTGWDGLHEGSCHNPSGGSWVNGSISIAFDIWILAIPLWQLRTLNLHWKKKAGVAVMFCVGALVTIVSFLRLQALVHLRESSNPTWDFYDVSLWSTMEICVGIMCACFPTVRILLIRLWPALGSSVRSNGNHYQQYGSNNRPKTRETGGRDIELVVPNRPNSEEDNDTPGVDLQKTPTVHYSDNDEASLVHRADLPGRGT